MEALEGLERLTEAQSCLGGLLVYLEAKEGFSLFPGRRLKYVSVQTPLPEAEPEP